MLIYMDGKTRHNVAIAMGIVIAVADLYWTYTSAYDALWLALGVIIFLADIIWLYVDM